jgi:hypothetical protein
MFKWADPGTEFEQHLESDESSWTPVEFEEGSNDSPDDAFLPLRSLGKPLFESDEPEDWDREEGKRFWRLILSEELRRFDRTGQ